MYSNSGNRSASDQSSSFGGGRRRTFSKDFYLKKPSLSCQLFLVLAQRGSWLPICRGHRKNRGENTQINKTGENCFESMYVNLEGRVSSCGQPMNPVARHSKMVRCLVEIGLMFKQPRNQAMTLSLPECETLRNYCRRIARVHRKRSFQMGLALETLASQRSQQEEVHNYFDENSAKILNVFLFFNIVTPT